MHIKPERITFTFKTSDDALIRITLSAWMLIFGGKPRCVDVTIAIQEDTVASTPPSYASAKNDPLLFAVASSSESGGTESTQTTNIRKSRSLLGELSQSFK